MGSVSLSVRSRPFETVNYGWRFGPRAANKIHNATCIYYFYDSVEIPGVGEGKKRRKTRGIEDCAAESFSFAFRSTFGPGDHSRPSSKVAGSFYEPTRRPLGDSSLL